MALSPSTQRAVTRAISALTSEVGEVPQFKDLLDSMKRAVGSRSEGDGAATSDLPGRDGEDDDYSFDTAARRHKEKLDAAAPSDAPAEDAKAEVEGGEGK